MTPPRVLFIVGLLVFAGLAGPRLRMHSNDNHFVYLADAFLHGQLELVQKPPHENDWASFEVLTLRGKSAETLGPQVRGFFTKRAGKPNEFRLLGGREVDIPSADRGESERKYFVSFPPLPSVLMLPLVAIAGYGANDVIFTLLFAALNVVLVHRLLRTLAARGYSQRSEREDLWLTVLFSFGSVFLWCSILGQVWYTALVIGVTFNLLYILNALDARRPFLAGVCLALGFATRTPLAFAAVFFVFQLRGAEGQWPPRDVLVKKLALFVAPCLVVGVTLLVYNYVRFENPLEFGHSFLASGTIARIRDVGLFDTSFLSRNLTSALTLLPRFTTEAPYVQFSRHGMSLLLTTPALVWLLWPMRRHIQARWLGLTALSVAVPIFFYQNTGWAQFGFRFSLDFMPYLIGCLAIGGRPINRPFKGLIIAGIVVNLTGALVFQRSPWPKLFDDHLCEEPKS